MAGVDIDISTVDNTEFEDDDWNLACQAVRPLVAKWRKVGQGLGLTAAQLDEIQGNNPSNTANCLDDALQVWISQNYNVAKNGLPSWRTLCKAVQSVDPKAFRKLASEHGGKVTTTTTTTTTTTSTTSAADESKLSLTPTADELQILKFTKGGKKEKLRIITEAAGSWRKIAALLKGDADALEERHKSPDNCLSQLFDNNFIKKKPEKYSHDWNGIVELLDDVGLEVLSEKVKEAVQLS